MSHRERSCERHSTRYLCNGLVKATNDVPNVINPLNIFNKKRRKAIFNWAAKGLFFPREGSLRASSPIWASETSLARMREQAEKPRGVRPLARAFSRGLLRLPKKESLLAG